MLRLLAAGGVVVLALLALLTVLLGEHASTGSESVGVQRTTNNPATLASIGRVASLPVAAPVDGVTTPKLDPGSDAFFFQFQEVVPGKLGVAAAECYHGGLDTKHRHAKLRLAFVTVVKDGVVRIEKLRALPIEKNELGLDDPAMEACMLQKVGAVSWKNDVLPDGEWDDRLVIRPGMEKYSKANLEYEGSGPIGKAVMTPGQAPPRSDTATREDFERASAEN